MAQIDSYHFDPMTFLSKAGTARIDLGIRRNEVIFCQGDPADYVYYVERGLLKLSVASKQGKEAVFALVQAKTLFGEECLTDRPLRVATATAIHDSVIARVEKRSMMRMLRDDPECLELFTSYLLTRKIRIEEDLIDQLLNSSEKRLARVLLSLSQCGSANLQHDVVPKLSQETLAAMVGTTRSRVSYFMNKFRRLGFIDYQRELRVNTALLGNFVLQD